jgi:small redox-active disulfide protein 2
MEIKVLGPGCAKCKKLYDLTLAVVKEVGVDATVTKVERLDEIMAHGIVFTPGLIIDGKVVSTGKLPKAAKISAWIQEAK